MSKGFSKKSNSTQNTPMEEKKEQPFVRDESDNKLFPEIQVKDISSITKKETEGVWDFDTPIFQVASNSENKFITVTHKTDKSLTEELKGIVQFKGQSKVIPEGSWLGLKNIDRVLSGKEPYTVEDFDVVAGQRLKIEDEDKAFETAKIQIYKKIKNVKQQYGLDKVKLILGSGDNFRNELDTCRPYKGNRVETLRPLLLSKLREWVLSELNAEFAQPRADGKNVEADDVVEYYGNKGYLHYRKHGWFNYVVLSSDKDSFNSAKMLIDPDKHTGEKNPLRGKHKFPQAMLIEATDKSAGDLTLVVKSNGKEIKGYGFKFLMYQAALGQDGADNYDAIGHLKQGLNFGSTSAYEALKPYKTAKECLQAAIDVFAKLLPYGVQYTTHDGRDIDVDCMTYMNTYFLVAYMNRSATDTMDFYKLCDAFKVDTSKIVGNNKLTAPIRTFVGNEDHINSTQDLITSILKEDFKGIKTLKKADQAVVFDRIKGKLESIDWEAHYEMIQTEKVL